MYTPLSRRYTELPGAVVMICDFSASAGQKPYQIVGKGRNYTQNSEFVGVLILDDHRFYLKKQKENNLLPIYYLRYTFICSF